MAVPPKVADSEMKYFQFKARQMFLLQKEDREWQEFCKKNASNCAACLAEKYESKTSKNVGIQTSTKNVNRGAGKTPVPHSFQSRQTPETINFIKTKLEKIDLTLTEMLKIPSKETDRTQESRHIDSTATVHDSLLNALNDSRRQLIQKSLKESIQRLQASSLQKQNSIPASKFRMKNSGYFLPHDLQKQRIIARKAYLASLPKNEGAPKVTSTVNKRDKRKAVQQDKKQASKNVPKSERKVNMKPKKKLQEEPTLLSTDQQLVTKDENIEDAVDGILDDLLGETVLVVNKIKLMKGKKRSSPISPAINAFEMMQNHGNSASKLKNEPASSQGENTAPKSICDDYKETRENLFMQKYGNKEKLEGISENGKNEPNQHENFHEVHVQGKTTLNDTAPICHYPHAGIIRRTLQHVQCKKRHEISIDAEATRRIIIHRKEFWKYLQKISLAEIGSFNPWTLSNTVAEAILDDCLQNISNELSDLPSTLVTKLYKDEFTQLY